MEYRIIEKYNKRSRCRYFYPEYKKRFFWYNLRLTDEQITYNYYLTFKEAKDFILERMPKVIFHCIEYSEVDKKPIIYGINNKH